MGWCTDSTARGEAERVDHRCAQHGEAVRIGSYAAVNPTFARWYKRPDVDQRRRL